jgi:hypothetical protein
MAEESQKHKRFLKLLSTRPMKLAREKVLLSLEGYFVALPNRRFMIQIIENALMASDNKPVLYELAEGYLWRPHFITKPRKDLIKQAVHEITAKFCSKELVDRIDWTYNERLYAFTRLGVSDIIIDIFCKIGVFSWSVVGRCICAGSDRSELELRAQFCQEWSCPDFTADSVLEIISFTREPAPDLLVEY